MVFFEVVMLLLLLILEGVESAQYGDELLILQSFFEAVDIFVAEICNILNDEDNQIVLFCSVLDLNIHI